MAKNSFLKVPYRIPFAVFENEKIINIMQNKSFCEIRSASGDILNYISNKYNCDVYGIEKNIDYKNITDQKI
jgi:hypothetical protein